MYVYIYILKFFISLISLFFSTKLFIINEGQIVLYNFTKRLPTQKKKTCVDVLHLKIKYKQLALVNIQVFVIFPKKKKEKKVVVIICASD